MTDPITIPKEIPKDTALSYDFLRKEGIELIQKMAGNTWTDHNIHDPGITILEQLCYAITDLAYRMDYDIKDVIGSDGSSSYKDLYSAATILTVNPVTVLDLRKIVIDVEGVKNAWVEKVSQNNSINTGSNEQDTVSPKGLYRVFIERDELVHITGSNILAEVKSRLQSCRGVCEDFEEIRMLDTQPIRLQGTIEITHTVDNMNQMVANILHRVNTHFSPRIYFYTLQQLVAQGKRTDEIFDGPRLKHGFINDEELLQRDRKKEIQTSDIIREIMDETGILAIDELSVATGANTIKSWLLPLDLTKTPSLDVDGTLQQLTFTSQGLTVNIDKTLVKTLYNQKRTEGLQSIVPLEERDINIPETVDRNIENYYSIQNQFPANYGIGNTGLPNSVSETRKAQGKQLTSYLVFFEQILANYFSQTANFKKLMSFDGQETKTYFNQSLLDTIPGLENVLVSKENYEKYLQEINVDTTASLQRKNKFLNHLLSRFSEQFTGYGMLLQNDVTNTENDDAYAISKKLILDKAKFLQEYPSISAARGNAYNYTQSFWDTANISGLEKRIALKLGIKDYTRRNLGETDKEGFHMIEHILLRPRTAYPFPLEGRYSTNAISRFEAIENTENTQCISNGHDLKKGEHIRIQGTEKYDGEHTILSASEDGFEIAIPFNESVSGAIWQRVFDIRYYVRTSSVYDFTEVANEAGHTFCKADVKKLQVGDQVEITGTQPYDGIQEVVAVHDDGFEIPVPFVTQEPETIGTGRWMQVTEPVDPYSFQLSFMLPAWLERYQDASFKKFVEHTIQEETPVHLRPSIKWLQKEEMKHVDQAFHAFLSQIN
ncbi:hypothetical protein [uncultured Aquimarina sp.]|uniref:hypothetical protein n=1 Tax=uncultured Aquimarina sp. TaxID=575652 RepID=UPI0026032823|nr:hypothetical protein [uncultured Aquimarina sp.]